jgi:beta-phosphoglucomutase-like phosphatase (HAD superfamily)
MRSFRAKRRSFFAVATASALVLLVFASCGSSSPSLTRAEYVKKANAICKEWQEERNKAFGVIIQKYQGQKPTPQLQQKAAEEAVLDPYEHLTQKLAALDTPEEDGEKAQALLTAMEGALAKVKANPRVVVSGSPFTKADHLAADFGLDKCKT